MSSSPEPAAGQRFADGGRATGWLWASRGRSSPAVGTASALLGHDAATLTDAVSIALGASVEAQRLLDGMELRIRTLPTGVSTDTERCVSSVRGPVQWSETITARANALGNDDVFVCAITNRSFDTVENRLLVSALDAIGRAERALRGPTGDKVPDDDAARIAAVAKEAASWRAHPRLKDVRSRRVVGRDLSRLRGGHRMNRMAAVLAVRSRVDEPFVDEDLIGLADPWTIRYHAFVAHVLGVLGQSLRLPSHHALSDAGLWWGSVSWRHPGAGGGTPPGLCYRGIPLLPPAGVIDGAPWADSVPDDGVRLLDGDDLDRLGERLTGGRAASPNVAAQASSSS